MILSRYLSEAVQNDLKEKMVFMSGPRQVGKTTFAKTLLQGDADCYYNWDKREDRKTILAAQWPTEKSLVILDELHKYGKWKRFIKGEYDTRGAEISFLVPGSARMDVYRKGGDSLQGRYHAFRLHGFSMGEMQNRVFSLEPGRKIDFPREYDADLVNDLFHYGSFPEPLLKQDARSLRRWRKERLDRFFREDVRDLENVRDMSAMEILTEMLEERIGSLLSLQSIREDLEVSHRSVTNWMEILDRLYYSFRIQPFTHNSIRSLKKMSKVFLWDWSGIRNQGARFENLTACHLLKMKHYLEDREGYRIGLYYLRDADKREVDFLVTVEDRPWFAVECKLSKRSVNPALTYFGDRLEIPWLFQICLEEGVDVLDGKTRIMSAGKFLSALP
ncbi:MAG: ATP-binding protein [SAR324 cluster bacterium]|nr:ATP-binding protein [SAR324 cluster bacterium]